MHLFFIFKKEKSIPILIGNSKLAIASKRPNLFQIMEGEDVGLYI